MKKVFNSFMREGEDLIKNELNYDKRAFIPY